MKIKILFAQRKYGDQAPEALAVVDEYTDDENPDYFKGECEKQLKALGDECDSHRIIEINVSDEGIAAALAKVVEVKTGSLKPID